jgi:hypothetical protein
MQKAVRKPVRQEIESNLKRGWPQFSSFANRLNFDGSYLIPSALGALER